MTCKCWFYGLNYNNHTFIATATHSYCCHLTYGIINDNNNYKTSINISSNNISLLRKHCLNSYFNRQFFKTRITCNNSVILSLWEKNQFVMKKEKNTHIYFRYINSIKNYGIRNAFVVGFNINLLLHILLFLLTLLLKHWITFDHNFPLLLTMLLILKSYI